MVTGCLRIDKSNHTPRGNTLTERIRALEEATRIVLPARSFVVVRVDGKTFSKYTKGLTKPFDNRFGHDMDLAALAMVNDFPGAHLAYVASDEISLIASDLSGENTQPHLGGVHSKVVSLTAARVTAVFNAVRADLHADRRLGDLPLFDSRAFTVADRDDLAAYLNWRLADTRRNSLAMLCDKVVGKKATVGKGFGERVALLAAAGVDWAEVDPRHARGRIVVPTTTQAPVTFTRGDTGEVCTTVTTRRTWVVQTAPERVTPEFLDGLLPTG